MQAEGRAVQFIAIDPQTRELVIKEEAVAIIKQFQARCKNFAVMVVVGKYRTGKSYLINQVLLQSQRGFDVGSTINACTKGLWMWSELIYFPSSRSAEPIPTLLLDTEGIGSVEEEQNHDVKIFLLAMLLSSYFIYNSVGTIDDMALQNLGLIVNLTKFLQKADEEVQKDIFESFPSFLWVLRDFSLKLEDEVGNKISPKEYLENALKPLKGFSESIENKNKLRRHIMQFFGERDCFTLVRPVQDEKQLQQLSSLPMEMLRPEFVDQVMQLRKKFTYKVHTKQYRNKAVTPSAFVEMCRHFIDSINGGEIPAIQSQWTAICSLEMKRIAEEGLSLYDRMVEELLEQSGITRESLEVRHALATQRVKQFMEENSLDSATNEFKEHKRSMKVQLEARFAHYVQRVTEIQEQELKAIRETYIYTIQTYKPTDLWDLGEFGQKAMLEFIEQGGSGEHLSLFIRDFWASMLKQLQSEVYTFQTKISQAEDEVRQAQCSREEVVKEVEALRRGLLDQQREYEQQLTKTRLEVDAESKKAQSLGAEVRRLQIVVETHQIEHTSKLRSMEAEHQDQLAEKGQALMNMEARLQKALIDCDKAKAAQRQGTMEAQEQMTAMKVEADALREEVAAAKAEVERLTTCDLRSSVLSTDALSEFRSFTSDSEMRLQKEFLEKQLKTAQGQLDDHKRFNDALISTILTSKQKTSEQSSEQSQLITTNNVPPFNKQQNKRLGKAVEMAEARCRDLEQSLVKLKKFHKLVKMSNAMECRFCTKLQKSTLFEAHLAVCRKRNTQKCGESDVTPQQVKQHPHFEVNEEEPQLYLIQVTQSNQQWTITKTLDEILKFQQDLKATPLESGRQLTSGSPDTLRGNILQFLNEISFTKDGRSSSLYERFIEQQRYPSTSELNLNEPRIPLKATQKKSLLQMFQQQKVTEKMKKSVQIENQMLRRSNKHVDPQLK